MVNHADPYEHLASVPLFKGLSRRQRRKLLSQARVVTHSAGDEVAKEGEGALAMHLVLDGTARVTVDRRDVRTLGAGDYFGEISMIDGKPRSATVTAGEALRTLAVPHIAFKELVAAEPDCARELMVALCVRVREAESRG